MRRRLFLTWLVGLGLLSLWPGAPAALGAVRADFNGDGRDDLAVGVPSQGVGGAGEAGAVNVLYGANGGLSATGNQFWRQNSPGVLGTSESGDNFGYAVAAGDFNGDGRDDLAVGVPIERVDGVSAAGAVNVLYGGAGGLSATGNQLWSQNSTDVLDAAQAHDGFGSALAVGDLNGDGSDDLTVGVVNEKLGTAGGAGAVNVLYGSAGGLSATGNQFWSQDSPGVFNVAEANDGFGSALAARDLNGDGRDDLAVGVPYEDLGNLSDAGAVNVLYGRASGLSPTGNQFWDQDSAGIMGVASARDKFGFALAAGNFNGAGGDDLAVGVPGEDVASASDAGAINVLYGDAGGLSTTGNKLWQQSSAGVTDTAEANDDFGSALAAADLNGDGRDDLAVGVPFEDVESVIDAGAVSVLYGDAGGLSATGNQLWDQDSAGVADSAEQDDGFGFVLAAGNFNGDLRDDLAVGVPFEDLGSISDAGVANVLYGRVSGLTASGNQRWDQDNNGVGDAAEAFDNFSLALASGDGL
jgi:FG-GAP repeat